MVKFFLNLVNAEITDMELYSFSKFMWSYNSDATNECLINPK